MYYRINALAGHVGSKKSRLLTFYIEAESVTDALKIVRSMPMVKHNHPRAIQSVKLITKEEYDNNINYNAYKEI